MGENFIRAIEESIGSNLNDHAIDGLERNQLHALAVSLGGFFKVYTLPAKQDGDLRPYIFHRFYVSDKLGLDRRWVGGGESSLIDTSEFISTVKRLLLYSHGICIYDGLIPLLDFFRLDPDSPLATKIIPSIKALLKTYSRLSPLIKKGILIPVSDDTYGRYSVTEFSVSDDLQARIARNSGLSLEQTSILLQIILEQQYINGVVGGKMDLFFPAADYTKVLKEIFNTRGDKFSSLQIRQPLYAGEVLNLPEIEPDRVTVEDVIKIRQNEDAFEEFRGAIRNALARLQDNTEDYTDRSGEFLNAIREELQQHKSVLDDLRKKSSFKDKLRDGARNLAIGIVTGGITTMASSDPKAGAVAGVAATVYDPALHLIFDLFRLPSARADLKVLRAHYLALGMPPTI